MDKNNTYIAIDLKSFYASVECVDRKLDPMTTNLVVADPSRTDKTICLAVSPALKSYGIPGRPRLFEVKQKVSEVNAQRLSRLQKDSSFTSQSTSKTELDQNRSLELSFITAVPRMARYLEISSNIYSIYLKYIAPEDIHIYSIDEVFIDMTHYLSTYNMSAETLAKRIIREVLFTTGITATAGIGTNLYLAKVAMDIVAKHTQPNQDGVRIASLNEESFRYLLWDHKPLTDFWMTGPGTAKKLYQYGIQTMGDLARYSLQDEDMLYKIFGIDAELLIDHAWGIEPCGLPEIKAYQPNTNCITEGQVLKEPYPYEQAKVIVQEMSESLVYQLTDRGMVTDSLTITVGYDRSNVDLGNYRGPIKTDHYGRSVPKSGHGTIHLDSPSNLGSQLTAASLKLFEQITDPRLMVRRITINANRIIKDPGFYQLTLFSDTKQLEKEKKLQETMLSIKKKYGKNAILKGTNFKKGATMIERNEQIGGHKS